MNYQEIPPPASLDWFVRCFWTLSAPSGERPPEPALPDGCPELILNLGDPFRARSAEGRTVDQPLAMLVGQITRPLAVAPTGRVDLVAVRFRPFGASLLHAGMSSITDRWLDVQEAHSELAGIVALLRAAPGGDARLTIVRAMLAVASAGRRPDARVIAAVERIEATDGSIAVADLAGELGTTARHLQRLFGDAVGISPKLLCRVRRFQRVFSAWRDDPGNWAAVAVRCGYFDQSHLVRDFSELGGSAPAGLVAALPEFTRLFTALNPGVTR